MFIQHLLPETPSEPAQCWVPHTGTDQWSEAGSGPKELPLQPGRLVDVETSMRGEYTVDVGDGHLDQVLKGPSEREGCSRQGEQHEQRLRGLPGDMSACVLGEGWQDTLLGRAVAERVGL